MVVVDSASSTSSTQHADGCAPHLRMPACLAAAASPGYSVGATIAALGALSWAEPPFRYRCPELAFRGLVLISPAIGLVQHGLLVRCARTHSICRRSWH